MAWLDEQASPKSQFSLTWSLDNPEAPVLTQPYYWYIWDLDKSNSDYSKDVHGNQDTKLITVVKKQE